MNIVVCNWNSIPIALSCGSCLFHWAKTGAVWQNHWTSNFYLIMSTANRDKVMANTDYIHYRPIHWPLFVFFVFPDTKRGQCRLLVFIQYPRRDRQSRFTLPTCVVWRQCFYRWCNDIPSSLVESEKLQTNICKCKLRIRYKWVDSSSQWHQTAYSMELSPHFPTWWIINTSAHWDIPELWLQLNGSKFEYLSSL